MAKTNWSKIKKNNSIPIHIKKEKVKKKWQIIEEKYGKTYDKNTKMFYINRVPITKYYKKGTVFNGCYFNAIKSRFEMLSKGDLLSSIDWKVGQPALVEWYEKFIPNNKCS